MSFVSPNEMLEAAKKTYLAGKDPQTEDDWALVINFVAFNVSVAEREICKLFKKMYDIPLSDDYIEQIAQFQIIAKAKEKKDA